MSTLAKWIKPGDIPKRVVSLCFFGLLVRLVLAWLPERYSFYLVSDDAYYYFAIARNLANRGMLSADGITATNGFHPLWLFVITPVFALFKAHHWLAVHFTLTLSAVFDTAAGFLIYRTLERLGKTKVGFWAAAFYLANPYGLLHTMNGLETALNNFFLALLLLLSVRATAEWLQRGWFLLGTVCGLALLSRTDNVFAVFVLLGYVVWRHRNVDASLKTGGVTAMLLGPWLLYNYLAFHSLVQTSGTAYPWLYHQQYLSQHESYLSMHLVPYLLKIAYQNLNEGSFHYGTWIVGALLCGFVVFRLKENWASFRPAVWPLFASFLFIFFHLFVRWSMRPWYPQVVFVLTLPLVALSLDRVKPWLLGLGGGLCLLLSSWEVRTTPFRLADRSRIMLNLIEQSIPPGDRVGAFNSGFIQYFTDRQVINLDGLVNNEVLAYYKKNEGLEYLRERNIRWLLDAPTYISKVFGPYFGLDAESSLEAAEVVPDIAYTGNLVALVAILPEGQRPLPGREVWIAR